MKLKKEKFFKNETNKLINLRSEVLYDAFERTAGEEAALFITSLEFADPIDMYLDSFIEANKGDPQILNKIQRAYDVAAVDIRPLQIQTLRPAHTRVDRQLHQYGEECRVLGLGYLPVEFLHLSHF